MRNLSAMNNLHNAQDVILLCEIKENCFQLMYDRHVFNPRICKSATTLSGCIEREEVVEIFQKTLTGGFSCINIRLSFNTDTFFTNFQQHARGRR